MPAVGKAPPHDPGHARATLIAETTGVVPGGTVNLAVHFDIDDPWYLYWKGQNDSGLPVSIEWTLPEGATAGELQWPAPTRVVLPGDIVDYIYKGGVTLMTTVQVPASASGTFKASAHVDYLVCDQVCLPGDADLEIALPVVASVSDAKPSASARAFEIARATVAKPWSTLNDASVTWTGATMTLTVPGATSLVFMPEEQFARLSNPIASGTTSTNRIVLTFDDKIKGATPRARGIVEVHRSAQTQPDYYLLDIELPKSTAADPARP